MSLLTYSIPSYFSYLNEIESVLTDTDRAFTHLISGRSDFVGGIDNEALDFSQLEDFINSDSEQPTTYFADHLAHNEGSQQTSHCTRIEGTTATVALAASQQLSPRMPSPITQSHTITTTCSSANTPVPPGTAYIKNPQSYIIPHGLPDSPPDSGSEPPYSPQGHHESRHIHSPHEKGVLPTTELLLQQQQRQVSSYVPSLLPTSPRGLVSTQETLLLSHPVLTPLLTTQSTQQQIQQQPQTLTTTTTTTTTLMPISLEADGITTLYGSMPPAPKKRKHSQDGVVLVKQEPELGTVEHSCSSTSTGVDNDDGSGENNYSDANYQCIRFHPFQQTSWHALCDPNLKELSVPHYRVDADKGFNFSNSDDAFVCQKKNHFQITCHAQLQGEAVFVKTGEGLKKISSFQLHFYGVKVESPTQTIRVEQSQSDRSKKPFHPVVVEMGGERVTKVTVGRLHFSETTSNNMRKKGKPNPDQRYFYLVVGLHAHTADQTNYQVVAHASERIIVRASNPGQFESEGSTVGPESTWQRGIAPDIVYHTGRVGINIDRPDEALVVHGNIKVTGHIVQPSDARAKQSVRELDTREQLRNVQQLRVVRYRYAPEFAQHSGLGSVGPTGPRGLLHEDTGVIAQEVQRILPEAVLPAGDIVLPSGQRIDNFLLVNKERIFMENIGAVKELCKVTDSLETRIDQLERINKRLAKLKRGDSLKSSISSVSNLSNSKYSSINAKSSTPSRSKKSDRDDELLCSNKFIQIVIVILILIMAFCLVAMATLYFLEYQKRISSMEWTSMSRGAILAVGPSRSSEQSGMSGGGDIQISRATTQAQPPVPPPTPPSPSSSSTYDLGKNPGPYAEQLAPTLGGNGPSTPSAKQHLYSQEITWYPIAQPGSPPKLDKNELSSNWLSKNGPGAVPSNVDENDQGTDVDAPPTPRGPVALGKPAECSSHFSELDHPCKVYCCTIDIHQFANSQPERIIEKKAKPDHLEQPQSIHEEKRKLSKGIQNGISPSDPSTQTLVKESNYKYVLKRNRRSAGSGSDWGEVASNAAGSIPPEPRPQLHILAKTFNASLDHRYCSASSPNNFSCIVPLSKYMSDTQLTLRFVGMPWYWQVVHQCTLSPRSTPDESVGCSWSFGTKAQQQSQFIETANQAGDQSFQLDAAHYLRKTFRFRIPTVQPQDNVCKDKQGGEFMEFAVQFYRDCEE
ncbi:hypothetical protein QAD02_008481 [Eretmocerus hayati]|uniref:Uncharacterized protein n=1 Tax=Eretmocerus hayati TaxID=131215 RepID=A0ACC2N6H8_9HYME|nr:hypothetical protein QAD02_008481 [Eretmocerus hayati]